MKKDKYNYIILIAIIIFVILFTIKCNNIFGSETDWVNQHTVIPEYFRNLFYQTKKLIPDLALNYGAGQNIYNLSYYGFLSPIILPSYFLPFISMKTYIIITSILSLFVSAILYYKFLKSHNYDNYISLITSIIFILADPIIFQMHRHVMFVNYMPFLIMSLIGVDKYLYNKKLTYLITSIFLMIMTSYYYSVCGILVIGIYFLYEYLKKNKNFNFKLFIKNIFPFIIGILLAVIASSIIIIPTFYTLLSGRGDAKTNIDLLSLFIPDIKIYKLFSGTYSLGLSAIGIISILYLFLTKKKENRIIASIISLILLIPIFKYILNGGLYLREKCFIPFIPLISYFIAYFLKNLFNNKIKIKYFVIAPILLFIITYKYNINNNYIFQYVYLVFLIITYKKYNNKLIISLFIILSFIGTSLHNANLESTISYKEYNNYFNKNIDNSITNMLSKDKSFYRSNNLMNPTITVNKVYTPNYYSTNIYSSTYNKYYLDFVKETFKLNRLEYNYSMIISSNNILFNSFMGVKYLFSNYDPGLGYEKINEYTYKNTLAYPIIYTTNNIMSIDDFNKYSYPYQNELLLKNVIVNKIKSNNQIEDINTKEINLEYDIIESNDIEINDNTIKVKNKGTIAVKLKKPLKNKILYIDLYGLKENTCGINNIQIKINNVTNTLTCKTWLYSNKNNIFRFVINEKNLTDLKIEFNKGYYKIDNIKTYVLDYNKINNLNNNLIPLNDIKISNNKITGNITSKTNSYLVTSIPYDKGFKIKIDGKYKELELVNTAFIGIPLEKGYHNIEISYESPYIKISKILSLTGIIIIFINYMHERKKTISFK